MMSNLLTNSRAANDKVFEKVRTKIAALVKSHAEDAAKFPWVTLLFDSEL